ncbi:NVL [Mytilus edulis]|uniref:RIX7 n=1 Tax=Mytilus edulis TaxID=6550 RepID=A0A8S3TPG4_MYTED|nr:NVL [Mytilus edulis]
MGSDNFRQVGTFDFTEGIGTSVSGTASSFSCSNQSVSDKGFSKESVVTKRSEHSDSEGCIGGDGSVLSSYSGSTHSLLPRRFSHQESLPISFGGTHQFVYPFTPETGFFDFMGKIRDNSQSEFQFPGRTFSDRFGSSASSRREGSQGMSVSQCSDSVFICPSSSIASAGGFLDFDHGRHSTRTSNSESRRDPFLFSVSSEQGNSSSVSQSQYFSVSETCSRQSKSSGGCSLPFRVPVNTEWEIHPSVFQEIILRWDRPHIDLFATSLNHKLETYVSPIPDEKAWAVDAMTLSWKGMFSYMFPPFRLLPKILHKIQRDLCKTILIAPAWSRQSWFPELLLLCCAKPLCLPLREDLLSQFKGRKLHQGLENLHLHAWLLSGIPSEREAFLREQPSVSQDQSDNLQEQFMTPNGLSSVLGVCRSRLIHSLSLYNTLATGRRRSEIHALSISESCLRFASDKSSVTLLTDPSFLAKNQLPDKGSGIITIPALPPTSDNQVLCPVRALLVYLASSAKLRSAGSSRLFIPIKKGISDISAKTISTWICNTVILAYKSASSEVLVKHQVKAHEGGSSVRVVNQLLTEMDGLEERKSVFIMGATNRPDIIDPAILRPGRLDKTLYVGLPCPDDRLDILKTITKNGTKPKLSLDVDLESLAKDERCNCFTGADLAALVREASMSALKVMISSQGTSIIEVNKEHFNTAFTRVRPSVSQKEQLKYAKLKEQLQNG